jgi:hypothetical protein
MSCARPGTALSPRVKQVGDQSKRRAVLYRETLTFAAPPSGGQTSSAAAAVGAALEERVTPGADDFHREQRLARVLDRAPYRSDSAYIAANVA